MNKKLTKVEAVDYLGIEWKEFDNYTSFSEEIKGFKERRRWYFKKSELDRWNAERKKGTVYLTIKEYEKCFEFALKVVYGGAAIFQRTEMEAADNWITGIIAEHAFKKFMKKRFGIKIYLDEKVHPGKITPRDIVAIQKSKTKREPKLFVGIKSSKMKNTYLIADEHGTEGRTADVYIFVRVGLPRDHLFRYLRAHSFIKSANKFLKKREGFRSIEKLKKIPVWICGYCYGKNLERKRGIPGQDFDGIRHVKCYTGLRKTDKAWKKLISKL